MATQKTIAYLTPFPAHSVSLPIQEALSGLSNMDSLLTVIAEMAEGAQDDAAGEHRHHFDAASKFDRIKRLAWIAMEERMRIFEAVDKSEDVVFAHIENRIAA